MLDFRRLSAARIAKSCSYNQTCNPKLVADLEQTDQVASSKADFEQNRGAQITLACTIRV